MTVPPAEFILDKNATTKIRAAIEEYKGTRRLDIRELYFDTSAGQWRPSTKGISVSVGQGRPLVEALAKLLGVPEPPSDGEAASTPTTAPLVRKTVEGAAPIRLARKSPATEPSPGGTLRAPAVGNAPGQQSETGDSEPIEAGMHLTVLYRTEPHGERRFAFDLVGYAIARHVRTAVSVQTSEGKQFLGRKVGDVFRGALFDGPIGTIRIVHAG